MKVLIIFLILTNLNLSFNKILSTFYPIRLERQSNEDDTKEEYLLDINNKYYHAVLKADEYMKIPMTLSINGEEPKLYHHNYKCFKKGYIKNTYKSRVVLNDCEGMRGLFNVDNYTFFVKPSDKYEHGPFQRQLANEKIESIEHVLETYDEYYQDHECMVSDDMNDDESFDSQQQIEYVDPHFSIDTDTRSETKVLEISLMILSETLQAYFNNIERLFDTMTMSSYYSNFFLNEMNVVPLIMHMEIFKDENPFGPVSPGDFGQTSGILRVVGKYREEYFKPKGLEFDITYLLSHQPYGGALGWAFINRFCQGNFSVIYSLVTNPAVHAVSIAHELGHQFGFRHTNVSNTLCKCERICVMNARSSRRYYFNSSWSNCELDQLKRIANTPCLQTFDNKKVPFDQKYCGNGIIDVGEDCDCGHPSDCAKTEQIKCCDPVTCKLYSGNSCSKGVCCDNCMINNNDTRCSLSGLECFEAYCNGTDIGCQIKQTLPLGHLCGNNDICQIGNCKKFQSICQEYFGTDVADDVCFHEFNSRGDKTGNCGIRDASTQSYIPCTTEEDKLCGKIVCKVNPNNPLPNNVNSSIFNNKCGVLFKENSNEISEFMVPDGSPCGTNKICLNHKCFNRDVAISQFTQKICGRFATTNQKGECICQDGFTSRQNNECFKQSIYQIVTLSFIIIYIILEVSKFISLCFVVSKVRAMEKRYGVKNNIAE